MRMRVAFGGGAVRSPAGVGDAEGADQWGQRERRFECPHLADGAHPAHLPIALQYCDAGGVIATVFQALEALNQGRHDVAPRNGTNYSAHAWSILVFIAV